jgi:hypothetical protein
LLSRTLCTLALLTSTLTATAPADPIPVKHAQGIVHGFLTIRSAAGAAIGYGEFSQLTEGDRITDHLVYRFRDGSIDDETTVFAQHGTFQFVSDHHIQRGPFFPKPSDLIVGADGTVTLHTNDQKGKPVDSTTHIDLGPDISNGMIGTLLVNLKPDVPDFKLAVVVPAQGKARLIHFAVSSAGQQPFSVVGTPRKASVFRLTPQIGGIEGVLAPMVNKQPPNIMIWVLEGEAPLFVREVGQLSEDGPIVSIEFASASFPHQAATPPPAAKKK